MRSYKTGDRVRVVRPSRENRGTEGRVGTVVDDGSLSGGLMAVKGIDGRLAETIKGLRGYYAEELDPA